MQTFMFYIIFTLIGTVCNGGPIYWIQKFNLQPEHLQYYPDIGFLTSSMRYGTIYKLKVNSTSSINSANPMNFSATEFFSHPLLNFSTGFDIDFDRNILFICHSNPNVLHEWMSSNGTSPSQWPLVYGYMSGVMIVNLTTSKVIANFDLQHFNVNKTIPRYHYANNIVLDSYGNAYITDTCGGAIYKVINNNNNASYTLSIFSYKPSWLIDGYTPMFDGIVLDRKNEAFLLINALTTRFGNGHNKNGTSAMWKVPISNPMNVYQLSFTNVLGIQMGFDGQVFSEDGNYLYVTGEALNIVYQFISYDNWDSLTLKQTMHTQQHKSGSPTAVVMATNGIYGTGLTASIFVCGPIGAKAGMLTNISRYPIELLDFTSNSTKIIYQYIYSDLNTVTIIMYILIGVIAILIIVIIAIFVRISRYLKKQQIKNLNYKEFGGQSLDSPTDNKLNVNINISEEADEPILTVN